MYPDIIFYQFEKEPNACNYFQILAKCEFTQSFFELACSYFAEYTRRILPPEFRMQSTKTNTNPKSSPSIGEEGRKIIDLV
jgi:hypothetical protein